MDQTDHDPFDDVHDYHHIDWISPTTDMEARHDTDDRVYQQEHDAHLAQRAEGANEQIDASFAATVDQRSCAATAQLDGRQTVPPRRQLVAVEHAIG
eukprot:6448609-Pyramimonas_sp.AAC.1